MTATSHVLSGMLIGAVIHRPELALPLAFVSHFVLDSLPHFGLDVRRTRSFTRVLVLDMLLAAGFLLLIILAQPAYWLLIVGCGIAAASPDLMWIPLFVSSLRGKQYRFKHWYEKIHKNVQWSQTPGGLIIELLWWVPVVGLLLKHV